MIYCPNNNTLYKSAADVCRDLQLDRAAVSRVLSGERKTAGSYILSEINDLSEDGIRAARAWLLYSVYKIIVDVAPEPRRYERGENI